MVAGVVLLGALLGGIVAKGFGVILSILLAGIIIGVVLTLSVTARFRRRR